MSLCAYTGKILRVDLTTGNMSSEETNAELRQKFVGGSGLGAKFLYDEVRPGTEWDSPDNRLILMPGPLAGTKIAGSSAFSVVSKGPMTNLAGSTQANGNFGAFLKFSGFDGIIIQGKSPKWVYLAVRNGKAELREAAHLKGKDTFDTEYSIKQELGEGRKYSVFSIGPAGESLIRFAVICGDKGHIASKNGLGAVMGSKKLKAVAAYRGENRIDVQDSHELLNLRKKLFKHAKNFAGGSLSKWGTARSLDVLRVAGQLPVHNYTTNIYPEDPQINSEYIRTHYELKPKPCWSCGMQHCHWVRVTVGPYAGQEGEEPEYECIAALGPMIGNHDMGAVVMLSDLIDRLGLDANEVGWLIGWVMECYEKGILSKKQLDGLDMTWGNVEAVKKLLFRICRKEGIGEVLAEGVKRASEQIGGEAVNLGVYTMKGATPRGHDHRARWVEILDTCVSGTSTIEATFAGAPTERFGWPPVGISFSPWEVAVANAHINGWFVFLDSLVICYFCAIDPELVTATVNALTGWDLTPEDALTTGKRIVNLLRVFNLQHGLDIETETPSPRYGSTPTDGPAKGLSIMTHWKWMVQCYYEAMGWDKQTGKPHSHTLKRLGLNDFVE
jgi:aldehyde:ferredoxin oxidoreductase